MRLKKKTTAILLATMALVLTACSTGGGKGTTGGVKETLVVGVNADAVTFDIQSTNDAPTTNMSKQIYNTLIKQTEDLELVPALAESWEKIDDTTYEFKLREGVKFHNGETLTAADVAFTMERAKTSEQIGHIVGELDVTKIKVVDDTTIQLGTTEPFGPFLTHLAHPTLGILNEKAVTEGGEDYGTNPVGTGPYKFVNWEAGTEVNLERFDDYFDTAGASPKIKFRVIKENSVRLISLETGEIDIAYDVAPADIAKIEGNDDLVLARDKNLRTEYIGFNVQSATPVKDVKVRQAINHAINVQAILDTVYQGVGSPAKGPINELIFGSNQDLEAYDYDLDKANALLTEAGYPGGGFTVKLYVGDNNAQRTQVAEILKEELGKIGITVEITQLEWATYLDATGKGEHDMFLLGWTTVTTDGDYGLFPLFHSSQFGKAGNRTFYSNARVDELLQAGRVGKTNEERIAAYKEAQEIIRDEAPWVFFLYGEDVVAYSKRVTGFKLHPTGTHYLSGVSATE